MKLIFTTALFIVLCLQLSAQPGTFNKTLGEGGIVISKTYSGDNSGMFVQNDGKIISVGNSTYGTLFGGCLLVHYNQMASLNFHLETAVLETDEEDFTRPVN